MGLSHKPLVFYWCSKTSFSTNNKNKNKNETKTKKKGIRKNAVSILARMKLQTNFKNKIFPFLDNILTSQVHVLYFHTILHNRSLWLHKINLKCHYLYINLHDVLYFLLRCHCLYINLHDVLKSLKSVLAFQPINMYFMGTTVYQIRRTHNGRVWLIFNIIS